MKKVSSLTLVEGNNITQNKSEIIYEEDRVTTRVSKDSSKCKNVSTVIVAPGYINLNLERFLKKK